MVRRDATDDSSSKEPKKTDALRSRSAGVSPAPASADDKQPPTTGARALKPSLQLAPDDPTRVDYDKYRRFGAHHWEIIKKHPDYKKRVDTVVSHVRPGDRVLDLGCGDGVYMFHVAQVARLVTGVDGDPHGIEAARKELARHQVGNARLVHSSFAHLEQHLPARRNKFDLIYSFDCIEHLLDPEGFVDLIARYAAPGARVLVGTPLFISEAAVSDYHVQEFTADQVDAMLCRRFDKLGEYRLEAPVPGSNEMPLRFYVFHGRRRSWWRRWFGAR